MLMTKMQHDLPVAQWLHSFALAKLCLGTPAIFVKQTDLSYLYLGGPQGIGLHEMQRVHGAGAQNQRT